MTATISKHPSTPRRRDRRRARNREAIIDAASLVMARKGIDAATMQEIADEADVAAGTAYNYFPSKDALAMAVMESVMDRLGRRIETVTDTFDDPAQVYAYGCRMVMREAITDLRWRWLLHRSEVIADAMYRVMGVYAIRDLRQAVAAGRYRIEDPELAWRQATHALVGFALAVCDRGLSPESIDEAVVNLLCMAGMDRDDAWDIARRPVPALPPE